MYTCSNIVILTWVSMRTLFLLSAFKDVSKSCSNTSLLNHMYSFLLSIDVNYIVNANISGIQLMSGWYISFFYIHIISRLPQYSCMTRPGMYWPKCVLCNGWLCLKSRPVFFQLGRCGSLIVHTSVHSQLGSQEVLFTQYFVLFQQWLHESWIPEQEWGW